MSVIRKSSASADRARGDAQGHGDRTRASRIASAPCISTSRSGGAAGPPDLLVVLLVGVDAPQVVAARRSSRLRTAQHAGQHRVVLVVVAVQAVAADRSGRFSRPSTNSRTTRQVLAVARVVDRIGLRHAEDAAVLDVVARAPARCARAPACRARSARRRGIVQSSSPSVQKYSRPEAGLGRVGHHVRAPVLEVLDAADLARPGRGRRSSCRGTGRAGRRSGRRSGSRGSASRARRLAAPARGGGGSSFATSSVTGMLEMKSRRRGRVSVAAVARDDHAVDARARRARMRDHVALEAHRRRRRARSRSRDRAPHHARARAAGSRTPRSAS